MATSSPHRKLTYADFLGFPDDGLRHELIDGEHVVSPSPQTPHQRVSVNLTRMLATHVRNARAGRLYAAPFDVLLSPVDIVEPDLLFISAARASIVDETNVKGAPDLVVEILSPSTRKRDETLKLQRYEAFGVAEYWLVDPDLETIRVHRRRGAAFEIAADLAKAETLATPLLPGLSLPLAEVFE